ncbi:hypothetical protein [Lysobacter gummosus]|uniref:hypothetical protein n=1 Tax=Lysobacter gummosus TaxID=262324 RepID=UPI0036456F72
MIGTRIDCVNIGRAAATVSRGVRARKHPRLIQRCDSNRPTRAIRSWRSDRSGRTQPSGPGRDASAAAPSRPGCA